MLTHNCNDNTKVSTLRYNNNEVSKVGRGIASANSIQRKNPSLFLQYKNIQDVNRIGETHHSHHISPEPHVLILLVRPLHFPFPSLRCFSLEFMMKAA